MRYAKVSSKYQIVIPKMIREVLGLEKNDIVLFDVVDDRIELKKIDKILAKHIGSVKLKKGFKALRKEFEDDMSSEANT